MMARRDVTFRTVIPQDADEIERFFFEYAAYVNYGTGQAGAASSVPGRAEEISYSSGWRGMAARPFMSQAAEDGRIDLERGSTKLEGDLPKL
jgi:hypothetical protein